MTAWLLVVDMQPAFGAADSPWGVPGYADCADRVGALVEGYGDRVLFTRFVPPAVPRGAWRDYYARWSFAADPANAAIWELDPRWRGRSAVSSPRFSKWREAEAVLPVDAEIVLCGVSTDCCVLGTALEAVDAGRQVHLAADACAAGDAALHAAALRVMADRAPMLRITGTKTPLPR